MALSIEEIARALGPAWDPDRHFAMSVQVE